MKNRILKTIFIIIVTVLFIPTNVNAMSFKDGKTSYVLEEREITCLEGDYIELQGIDKESNLIFSTGDNLGDLTKVNEKNECVEMTMQEKLDFINSLEPYYRVTGGIIDPDEPEEDYEIVKQLMIDRIKGKVKTNDQEIVEGKTYYLRHSVTGFETITEPKKEHLNKYYEEMYFELPKSATIDENTILYVREENTGGEVVFKKGENLAEKDILNYFVVSEVQKEITDEKVADLNKEVFKPLFENSYINEAIKVKGKDEFYVLVGTLVDFTEFYPIVTFDVYKTDGTKINELEDIDYLDTYHNSLIGVFKDGLKIYNAALEVVYENKNLENLREAGYNNYTYYMSALNKETSETTYYNMYEYKVIDGDNQTYKDKELIVKFSGRLEKLTKVLVNDKELEESNYKLESGSTIVTLNKDYLSKLSKGTYTLTVEYENGGVASANFIIEEPNPETYDGITTYIILGIISTLGLVALAIIFRKQIKN